VFVSHKEEKGNSILNSGTSLLNSPCGQGNQKATTRPVFDMPETTTGFGELDIATA
jgi:hypothetical protein